MSKKTKAELEEEIKELKKEIKTLSSKRIDMLEKQLQSLIKSNNASYKYLYKAVDVTLDYLESVISRTKLIRRNILKMPNETILATVREFHDGNRVDIIKVINDKTKEQTITMLFYKRTGDFK